MLTLEQCGGDEQQIIDRLKTVLEVATQLPGVFTSGFYNAVSGAPFFPGTNVKFPSDRIKRVDRAAMWVDAGVVNLSMWAGELADQYKRLYNDLDSVNHLIAHSGEGQWELHANFHLAFPFSGSALRWYPQRHLAGAEYVRQSVADYRDGCAGARTRDQVAAPSFWQWLVDRRYAVSTDRATFEAWLVKQPAKRQIHIRPSVQLLSSWTLADATTLDRNGELTSAVRQAIERALSALQEPGLG